MLVLGITQVDGLAITILHPADVRRIGSHSAQELRARRVADQDMGQARPSGGTLCPGDERRHEIDGSLARLDDAAVIAHAAMLVEIVREVSDIELRRDDDGAELIG